MEISWTMSFYIEGSFDGIEPWMDGDLCIGMIDCMRLVCSTETPGESLRGSEVTCIHASVGKWRDTKYVWLVDGRNNLRVTSSNLKDRTLKAWILFSGERIILF